jgi:hypothetical protein
MSKLHRPLLIAALATIYLFGSYASLKAGLTWDEMSETIISILNFEAVKGLLHGDMTAYQQLQAFGDKYYGVGFHIPAQIILMLIGKPIAAHFGLADLDAYMLAKHWVVFSLFFCSGFLVRYLMRLFTGDEIFSSLAAVGYLLWPYMFGHAMINVKDVPFMFAWLLCTSYSFFMARRYEGGQPIGRLSVCLLAILTGWLISIRIAGVLISLQYMISLLFLWGYLRKNASPRPAFSLSNIPLFLVCLILFVYISYPVFWINPLQVFNAIARMSHSPTGDLGCTRIYGLCVSAPPPTFYIPAWLSVKLPVLVIAGYLILPLAFVKQAARETGGGMQFFKVALFTSLSIPLLLIVRHVSLYNEIRHILFLMPLFYCVGVASLYFVSRKAAVASLMASICIFSADQYLAFPYQYVWFNEVARQFKVEKYFETDYWGASGRGLANQLTIAAKRVGTVNCIYADPDSLIRPFMGKDYAGCLKWLYYLKPTDPRPYLTSSFSKTIFAVNCPELHREKFRLFLGKGDITVGRVQYCQ